MESKAYLPGLLPAGPEIEPGKSNQNAFIERFNRSLRNELLDLYLLRNLQQVRELTSRRRTQYNEHRLHN